MSRFEAYMTTGTPKPRVEVLMTGRRALTSHWLLSSCRPLSIVLPDRYFIQTTGSTMTSAQKVQDTCTCHDGAHGASVKFSIQL